VGSFNDLHVQELSLVTKIAGTLFLKLK